MEYSFDLPVNAEALHSLFQQTTWAKSRNVDGVKAMLENTLVALGAWEGEQLVGFARAITDGVYRAVIDDVVVNETFRGQGVGSELMNRLLKRLAAMGVEEVSLHCGERVVTFYEMHGFEVSEAILMELSKQSA